MKKVNNKKSLYESIMKDVAKVVKKKVNEDYDDYDEDYDEYDDEDNRYLSRSEIESMVDNAMDKMNRTLVNSLGEYGAYDFNGECDAAWENLREALYDWVEENI